MVSRSSSVALEQSSPSGPDDDFLDAAFLERLRALFVQLRRRRRQRKQGAQQAPAAGHTREFKDHRHYSRGDDWRAIDWRLYARLDKLFIRVFEEIQELHVHVLLDRSASMAEPHAAKRRASLRLTVGLGFLALANNHRVSFHTLGDDCHRELPPLKGQGHVQALVDRCRAISFAGSGDLDAALARFRAGADRRGVAFVLTDGLGSDPSRTAQALRRLAAWPGETQVVRIADPAEAEPAPAGELLLEAVEGGQQRRIWLTATQQQQYRERYQTWAEELERSCAASSMVCSTWSTALPFETQFVELLSRGDALSGGR